MEREFKSFPAIITKIDEVQGIVEPIFAVMGVVDQGKDIIHPGAFTKTFVERGTKIRVVDQHNTDSITRVLGKPIQVRELGRTELPPDLLAKYPEASGGAWAQIQFNMKTDQGKNAFWAIAAGDVDEWSFGYDAIQYDFTESRDNGKAVMVRNLRELRCWEISPAIWGMNPATTTVGVKSDNGAADDEPADEPADESSETDDTKEKKEMTEDGAVQRLGDALQGIIHMAFTVAADKLVINGFVDRDERIMLSGLIGEALDVLTQKMPPEIAARALNDWVAYDMVPQKSIDPNSPISDQYKAFIEEHNIPPETGGELQAAILDYLQSQKVGRAISAANERRIMGAVDIIAQSLDDLRGMIERVIDAPEDTEEEPEDAGRDKENHNDDTPETAGSNDSPTDEKAKLLLDLERLENEISILALED